METGSCICFNHANYLRPNGMGANEMNEELKQLIEDAAKLLGIGYQAIVSNQCLNVFGSVVFDPLDPERGDLWKVAEAAELSIEFDVGVIYANRQTTTLWPISHFYKGDYQSQALAVLRAASAVLKVRGEE